MKKVYLAIVILCVFLTSCVKSYDAERGIENFKRTDADLGLCWNLIPENFIEQYPYVEGNYFIDNGVYKVVGGWEKVLLYIQYDSDTYVEAKAYAMEHLNLLDDSVIEYNSYFFYQNQSNECNRYPYDFNQFVFNDEKHTLVFIGFCVSVELHDEVDAVADDWPAFLEKYYGEWYSFS